MPEGPEVQTVVNTLEKQIKGLTICDSKVYYNKIIETKNFIGNVKNQQFVSFQRIGKFIVLGLTHGYMIIHLRMEGKFFIDTNDVADKHTHIVFTLSDGRYLKYHDTRKFGRLAYVSEIMDHPGIARLGVDVLDQEFNGRYLKQKLKSKTIPIKSVLLDQKIVTGIGNIYANEILYAARIHPEQVANSLSTYKVNEIVRASKRIIQEAIEMGGTTIRSYTSSLNVHGRFDQELKVHQQSNCPRCHKTIKKIYVNKRGTYYCPICQRRKKLRLPD